MIGGVLPLLRLSVPMTDAQAGWVVGTAFAIPYGATALVLAVLRRRRQASDGWLVGGVLLWTTGCMATGLAKSLAELTAARAALGIGQGMFVPVAIARLLDATEPTARSRALGLFTGAATFGRSTALLAAGLLLSVLALVVPGNGLETWRWLFVLTALPNLLVLAALLTGPKHRPAFATSERTPGAPWRALLPFFPVAVAPVLLIQAVLAWLPTLMVRDHGLSTPEAALLVGAVTLFAAPSGPVIAGWLIGRHRVWERHVPVLVLAALAASILPLAAMVAASKLAGAVASMAAMLLVLGMSTFGGLFGVQLLTPPSARVSVNGVFLAFLTTVGVGLGPLVAGVLTTLARSGGAALGDALLVTGGLAVLACALAVLGARRSFARVVQP